MTLSFNHLLANAWN